MFYITKLALISFWNFFGIVWREELHLDYKRNGEQYKVSRGGVFQTFRYSYSRLKVKDPVVLVVGFRLKFIGSNRYWHWIFQRCCIMTTPFWSGFKGFNVKLWMVNPKTKDYLGIYQWDGKQSTVKYVEALDRVLRPLSTPDSVWYELVPKQRLEPYLEAHKPGVKKASATVQKEKILVGK